MTYSFGFDLLVLFIATTILVIIASMLYPRVVV
jgi:hypothetical protein